MSENISDPFKQQAGGTPTPPYQEIKPVARPVSRLQIDDLHKQLSMPKITAEFTPMGAVTRSVNTERDQAIIKEIRVIRKALELRRDAAKQAFERAHENKTVRRGPRR